FCFRAGSASSTFHSSWHPFRLGVPGSVTSLSGSTWQAASQCTRSGGSQTSPQSIRPLPQSSTSQRAEYPSQDSVLPSSHSSDAPRVPSPAVASAMQGVSLGSSLGVVGGTTGPVTSGGLVGFPNARVLEPPDSRRPATVIRPCASNVLLPSKP